MEQINVKLSKTTLIFRDIDNEIVICDRRHFISCYRAGGDAAMGVVAVGQSHHFVTLEILDQLQAAFIEDMA